MKSNPLGGIFADKMQNPQTHVNVILESLSVLDTTRDLFLLQNNPYINQTLLTRNFNALLNIIYNYPNDACSLDLISAYTSYANSKRDQNAFRQSPYNFLIYFLSFLEEEYNIAFKISNNFQKNRNKDIEKLANDIKHILQNTQRSIINQNYYFTIILNNKCNNCGSSNYEWAFKYILDLDLDKYKEWKRAPINLTECLQYYNFGKILNCENCGDINSTQSKILFNTGRVLIINVMRRNYTGQTDQYFSAETNINISQFKKDPNIAPLHNNYTLKARILYAGQYGYFADCFIKRNNMQGVWYRYCNETKREISTYDLNQFETILLFYESSDNTQMNNNMNNFMSNNVNNNVNYNANNNMINNYYNNYNNNYNNMNQNNYGINQNMNYQQSNNIYQNNLNQNPNRNIPSYQGYNNNYQPYQNYNANNNFPQNQNYSINNNMQQNNNYSMNQNNFNQSNNIYQNTNNNLPQNMNYNMNNNLNQNNNNVNNNFNSTQSQNNAYNQQNFNNFQNYGNNQVNNNISQNNKITIVYLLTVSCLLDFSSAFSSFFPLPILVLTLDEVLDKLAELIVGILIFNPLPSYFSSKLSELFSSSDISDSAKLPNLSEDFFSMAFWYFFFLFCSFM